MGAGLSKHEDEIRSSNETKMGNDAVNISSSSNSSNNINNINNTTSSLPNDDESKCPMKRTDGSYGYDWGALFRKDFPHGPSGSRPITPEQATAAQSNDDKGSGGCPVKTKHHEYNVYSQPIDPTNNMPQTANQLPAPGQTKPISTNRVSSTILKGGAKEGTTWTYPSPQMFYNALARKGKLNDNNEEQDMMETVVALHNDMNETSWRKVLQWEAVVAGKKNEKEISNETKLLKFQGRPADLSPKAWCKHYLLGHPLPFDRHDWVVLRADGTTARYVLDYYYNEIEEDGGDTNASSSINSSPSSSQTLLVDVRPALDGISPLVQRCAFMPWARNVSQSTSFVPLPMLPTRGLKSQVSESVQVWQSIQASVAQSKSGHSAATATSIITEQEAQKLVADFSTATHKCLKQQQALAKCASEEECTRATMDFTIGLSHTLCQLQHAALLQALQQDDETTIEAAFERVNECVTLKSQQHAMAKQQHPHLFQ